MSKRSRLLLVILLLILAAIALWFVRCSRVPQSAPVLPVAPAEPGAPAIAAVVREPAPRPPEEVLTPATLTGPAEIAAGAVLRVDWTGPNNPGDYVTIVRVDAPASAYDNYAETRRGNPLELTAPIEPGEWQLRYIAVRSKTVLGRAPLVVRPTAATLSAADQVVLGAPLTVTWTGPNHTGDYITLVRAGTPDGRHDKYTETKKGSPLTVVAPVETGEAELRYLTGHGAKVLARRPVKIIAPETALTASAEALAGSVIPVTWVGPNNRGDYITIVPKGTPDGRYFNYTETAKGSPANLTAPIEPGEAELRYMTADKHRVLARRAITIVAAPLSLEAPGRVVVGSAVSVVWTGPNNRGDYITLVPAATPDGQYGNYTDAARGSPLKVTAPMMPGPAELRYMSGQGAKVLARRPIEIVAAQITLNAPAQANAGAIVMIEWTGPNNAGDYLTIVPKTAKDGASSHGAYTSAGSPAKVRTPKEPGACEIRYMSGQKNRVLARVDIDVR